MLAAPAVPRRFRRRLLGVMLAAGLLPLFGLGALGVAAVSRALSLSPRRLDEVLQRADGALSRQGAEPALREELRQAQLSLLQAELARQSLLKLLPAALAFALLIAAAALGLGALLLGRALSRPLQQLTEEMARVARGELELPQAPLPDAERDELQFLLARLRAMAAELLEQRRRLQISESLAAWREVARALAHELGNPLTAIKMALARAQRVADRSPGDEAAPLRESLALLAEEVEVLLRLTQSFATFARLPAPRPRPLELGALLTEVCALYRSAGPVEVELALEGALPLDGDPDQLRRAFGNLIKNALEASSAGGGTVRVLARSAGPLLQISITDAGSGIPRALDASELTRSLGSTKAGGSGLGLPLANKIVHEHGGSLLLAPLPGRGTRALVELPARSR